MSLIEQYNAAVIAKDIIDDPVQRDVIAHYQRVIDQLAQPLPWYHFLQKPPLIKGVYLCGPVGAGKTYLMDMFYQALPETKKTRFHFHHFMQQVDQQLRLLQGHKNPLRIIAAKLAQQTRVLCLDEFLVNDVAYAMILAEFMQALFKHNVILIATANTRPDDLYRNGVRRERFLPAIALIKSHCEIIEVTETRDYRMGRSPLLQAYMSPLNKTSETALMTQFNAIAPHATTGGEISVQNRSISVVKVSDHAVWFEFDVICNLPRSQLDYLEIADRFDTIFVENIPILGESDTIKVLLLIHFIDVLYDRGVRLVISAAVLANQLYTSGNMLESFARTLSRLEEMQSIDYLNRHHHQTSHSHIE